MERFEVGRHYYAKCGYREIRGIYMCTRRTGSFVYFSKVNSYREIRRKPHKGYGYESVCIDPGYKSSQVRGITVGEVTIDASDVAD